MAVAMEGRWFDGCTSSQSVCATVHVLTYWSSNATHVVVRIRNWSGIRCKSADGIGRSICGIMLSLPATTPATDRFGTVSSVVTVPIGRVHAVGDVVPVWGWNAIDGSGVAALRHIADVVDGGYGVLGCETKGWGAAPSCGLSTCASPDEASWVAFAFTTTVRWSAKKVRVKLDVRDAPLGTRDLIVCRSYGPVPA
jgi:hypothetical protein